MKKILFLNDCNGHEYSDPYASLVEIPKQLNNSILKSLEYSQLGVMRRGGRWREIMADGDIEYNLISSGRKSDYMEEDYDEIYKLISGNY